MLLNPNEATAYMAKLNEFFDNHPDGDIPTRDRQVNMGVTFAIDPTGSLEFIALIGLLYGGINPRFTITPKRQQYKRDAYEYIRSALARKSDPPADWEAWRDPTEEDTGIPYGHRN